MKKHKLFPGLMAVLFMSISMLKGQQALVDSMEKRLQMNLPDSTRAMDMINYAMYTEPLNMDKAHQRYQEAVNFSLSKKLWYHAGVALRYEATPFYLQGQRQKELENIKKAEVLFLQSNHYNAKKELAATYGNLSGYYRAVEKFDSAVYYSLNAIRIQEENRFNSKLLISYINIAMIYQQIKLKDKQKEYLDKALSLAKILNESPGLFLANLQATHYYTEAGEYIKAKQYIDTARIYFNENIDFSRKQTYYLFSAVTFQNLKLYDSAVYFYKKAFELARQNNSRWNMIEPLLQMGNIKAKQKDFTNAENYLKQGIGYAEQDSAKTYLKDGLIYLSDLYTLTGRHKEALESFKKFTDIKDTLLNEERRKYVLDLEKKYESEKKDVQLQLQQEEIKRGRIQKYGLIIGAIILIILLLFSYRSYKQKQKLQQHRISELETEKKLMATEAVLKGEAQERTRLAKDLHDGLGGMLSGIKYSLNTMKGNLIMTPDNAKAFERSIDMLDSSIKEMRRVAHNMMPEVLLRYGLDAALKDYTAEINNSGIIKVIYQSMGKEKANLEQSSLLGLYRIIQELINNAIKHAAASEVLVQVFWENGKLVVNVEDNGKGFEVSVLEKAEGIGWKNIRSRVELLKGNLDIHSAPEKGTAVNIEFNHI
jgi:two-component system, NarL family, sensor kinase